MRGRTALGSGCTAEARHGCILQERLLNQALTMKLPGREGEEGGETAGSLGAGMVGDREGQKRGRRREKRRLLSSQLRRMEGRTEDTDRGRHHKA